MSSLAPEARRDMPTTSDAVGTIAAAVRRTAARQFRPAVACAVSVTAVAACRGVTDPPPSPPTLRVVTLAPGAVQAFGQGDGALLNVPNTTGTYALVVVNTAANYDASVTVAVRGEGMTTVPPGGLTAVRAASGPPFMTPTPVAGEATDLPVPSDGALIARLRRIGAADVATRVATARATYAARASGTDGPRRSASAAVDFRVGDQLTFNARTDSACAAPRARTGRVTAVGRRAVLVADVDNPAGGYADADYARLAAAFDTLVYPVDVRHFGEPTDLDGNGRVLVFYTRAVNELTPAASRTVVGGFFWNRDLLPRTGKQACAGSNAGELFYMLVPDPAGAVNGNRRTKGYVDSTTVAVLAHEFQHLINASRRLYVLRAEHHDEEVWLNEGLSHAAEELVFYQAAGLAPDGQPGQSPRARLTTATLAEQPGGLAALAVFNVPNLVRLSRALAAPRTSSPYGPDDDAHTLETRGAAWAFLRYASDRSGQTDSAFYWRVVNSTRLGLDNLAAATGAGAALPDWVRDWAVSNVADGAATTEDARGAVAFTQPSWVFRRVLPSLRSNNGAYPLGTDTLANGTPRTVAVAGGAAAYFTFAVSGEATLRVTSPGGERAPDRVRIALVRLQ